jgi:hypothetical protein
MTTDANDTTTTHHPKQQYQQLQQRITTYNRDFQKQPPQQLQSSTPTEKR